MGTHGEAFDQETARRASVELAQEVRMVWLLLLFQIFSTEIPLLVSLIRTQRTELLLSANQSSLPASSTSSTVGSAEGSGSGGGGGSGSATVSLEELSMSVTQTVLTVEQLTSKLKVTAATVIVAITGGLLNPMLHLDEEVQ